MVSEVVKDIDYTTFTKSQLLEAMGKAWETKTVESLKLMGSLSRLYAKAEQAEEKVKKDALQAELVKATDKVMRVIAAVIGLMSCGNQPHPDTIKAFTQILRDLTGKELDGAEGVWYARDFGEVGDLGACRLMKNAPRKAGEAKGTGSGSYIAGLPASAQMLSEVGNQVYIQKDTLVTIDKEEVMLPAGMTYKEAHELSTNGGWRNRIRMALGKATGRVTKA